MLGLRKQPSPCDPPLIAENNRAAASKPVIFVSACSSKKSKKKKKKQKKKTKIDSKWGGRRCRMFGDTALSFFLRMITLARVCVCVCTGTACGRPRLASGLYRDYICKTIRLNHFLNKRACPLPPLASSGPGQIGERRGGAGGRGEIQPVGEIFRSTFNICSRNSSLCPARRLTVSATRPRNFHVRK